MGLRYELRPIKKAHRYVTFMTLLKRILKMAQFEPLYLRCSILAGSFLIVVGVMLGGGEETIDMGVSLGEDIGDERLNTGRKELEGLEVVAIGPGPITCSKC